MSAECTCGPYAPYSSHEWSCPMNPENAMALEITERDDLIAYHAAEATRNLYRYKALTSAMRAMADGLCDCGSISGCHDTKTREALLSLLADCEAHS